MHSLYYDFCGENGIKTSEQFPKVGFGAQGVSQLSGIIMKLIKFQAEPIEVRIRNGSVLVIMY